MFKTSEFAALHEALRRSERMLAEAQSVAHVGSWEWDVRANRIVWSDELFRIYGLEPRSFDASYEAYLERLHPDDRRVADEAVRAAFVSGDGFEFRHRIVRPDGEVRVLLGRGRVERDAAGAVVRMIGVGQDITDLDALEGEREQRVRERARREAAEIAERRAQFLARASETLASTLDYEATLATVASLAVPELADWCAVDLLPPSGGPPERVALVHSDPRRVELIRALAASAPWPWGTEAPAGLARVLATGEAELVERISPELLDMLVPDGPVREQVRALGLASSIAVPLAARGHTLGVMLFATEGIRRLGREDLVLALDLARRAAVAIDNARLHQTLQEALADVQLQATQLETQAAQLEESAAELELLNDELRMTADALEARNEELDRARREAERANRAKGEFLSRMAHELRTPLNATLGYVELLLLGIRGPLGEEARTDLVRVQRSQRHLLALVNDILNFARLERGAVEYRVADVPLDPVLRELDSLVGPQLSAKGLDYGAEPCPEIVVR